MQWEAMICRRRGRVHHRRGIHLVYVHIPIRIPNRYQQQEGRAAGRRASDREGYLHMKAFRYVCIEYMFVYLYLVHKKTTGGLRTFSLSPNPAIDVSTLRVPEKSSVNPLLKVQWGAHLRSPVTN